MSRLSDITGRGVSRETEARLEAFAAGLLAENERQNLISSASAPHLWDRHILDAAQLLRFSQGPGSWVDIGSGPGLPGMVLAILSGEPTTLVEPRRLRVAFLEQERVRLGVSNVSILQASAASVSGRYDRVTARAVASAEKLFAMTEHLTHPDTLFILPKGKSAQSELEAAQRTWQGSFRLEPSLTSDEAAILVATNVRRRGRA